MGELADDMVNGQSCSWCGVYFDEDHGYPVICKDCFDDYKEEDYTKSLAETKHQLLKTHALQLAIIKEL